MGKFEDEEPAADVRNTASAVRQWFVALVHEGFTEWQALIIIGQIINSTIMRPPEDPG